MIIRAARPEDGPAIGKLVQEDFADAALLDWTDPGIADWWLVAEHDGAIIAALELHAAKPVGYIAHFVVAAAWRGRNLGAEGSLQRLGASVGRALYAAAEMSCRRAGVQRLTATIQASRGWEAIVAGHGFARIEIPAVLMRKDLGR